MQPRNKVSDLINADIYIQKGHTDLAKPVRNWLAHPRYKASLLLVLGDNQLAR